jgi:ferredoxin-type protein NapG
VLPRSVAQGAVDASYIKGWDLQDEERLENAPVDLRTQTERSKLSPLDYLNSDEFQDE